MEIRLKVNSISFSTKTSLHIPDETIGNIFIAIFNEINMIITAVSNAWL